MEQTLDQLSDMLANSKVEVAKRIRTELKTLFDEWQVETLHDLGTFSPQDGLNLLGNNETNNDKLPTLVKRLYQRRFMAILEYITPSTPLNSTTTMDYVLEEITRPTGPLITFVSYEELGSGKAWKSIGKGSDFFDEAKEFIESEWEIKEGVEEIHLACHVEGCIGRQELTASQGY